DEERDNVLKLNYWRRWLHKFQRLIEFDVSLIDNEHTFYSATADGNPEEQFIVKDRCTSYTSAQRSFIVWQILLRAKFDDTERSGIRRLLNDNALTACFPLHEGRYDVPHSSGTVFDRRKLYLEWARPSKWYKRQPICLIRKYFNDTYFCWF
ncbi:Anoctamin-6, partial [Pseudolycoriella hygida]